MVTIFQLSERLLLTLSPANLWLQFTINSGILFTSSIASYGELQPPFREDMIQVQQLIF